MKTDEMIAKILKYYNQIKEEQAQVPSGKFALSDAFENGEISSVEWILINVFNFETDDKRF